MDGNPRSVRESQATMTELMMPNMANLMGNVFGGVILSLVDRAAGVAATRHSRKPCVTVAMDRVVFREPIYLGELVTAQASVNYTHRTSMEVGVRIEAENVLTGKRRHTNSCYVTYVAVDEHGRPTPVPGVLPETPDEKRRFHAAEQRRQQRTEERESRG